MTYDEFVGPIEHLALLLKPPGWNAERQGAYFQHFQHWPVRTWQRACQRASDECDRFPSPKQLAALVTADQKRGKVWTLRGCPACEDGMIRFEVEKHGNRYEHYAACSCEAGDRVAEHMVQMARAKGRNDVTTESVRYDARPSEPPPWVNDYHEEAAPTR